MAILGEQQRVRRRSRSEPPASIHSDEEYCVASNQHLPSNCKVKNTFIDFDEDSTPAVLPSLLLTPLTPEKKSLVLPGISPVKTRRASEDKSEVDTTDHSTADDSGTEAERCNKAQRWVDMQDNVDSNHGSDDDKESPTQCCTRLGISPSNRMRRAQNMTLQPSYDFKTAVAKMVSTPDTPPGTPECPSPTMFGPPGCWPTTASTATGASDSTLKAPPPVITPAITSPSVCQLNPGSEHHTWFRVAFRGGVDLRTEPSFEAPRTGVTLPQNEVFAVSLEVPGNDGRIYLCLADGRGWAFDDTAWMPSDPSVSRGHWAPVTANPVSPLQSPAARPPPVAVPPNSPVRSPTSQTRTIMNPAGYPVTPLLPASFHTASAQLPPMDQLSPMRPPPLLAPPAFPAAGISPVHSPTHRRMIGFQGAAEPSSPPSWEAMSSMPADWGASSSDRKGSKGGERGKRAVRHKNSRATQSNSPMRASRLNRGKLDRNSYMTPK